MAMYGNKTVLVALVASIHMLCKSISCICMVCILYIHISPHGPNSVKLLVATLKAVALELAIDAIICMCNLHIRICPLSTNNAGQCLELQTPWCKTF
jgi:hypothetical protein